MAGVSEKEASNMVGATPEIMRKHYEKLDAIVIAKRAIEQGLAAQNNPDAPIRARRLRAEQKPSLDGSGEVAQNDVA
jgi:hypothetical protein